MTSKYKGKQNGKKPVKVFKQGEPVFIYSSRCCDVPATKKPCFKGNGEADDSGFFQAPLGTWKCTSCGKKCSVNRSKNKENDGQTQEAQTVPGSHAILVQGEHATI